MTQIISGLSGDMHGRSNYWYCQPVLWRSHQVIRNVHGEKAGRRKGQFGLLRFRPTIECQYVGGMLMYCIYPVTGALPLH